MANTFLSGARSGVDRMLPRYRELLDQLRRKFPQPVSDPVHDAYVAFSVLRALDRVDALKSQAPILGSPVEPDFAAALSSRVAQQGEPLEQVISDLVKHLEGMFLWGHPRSQINVISHPSIASIIGVMLASTYNPNLVSDESGRGFSAAEVACHVDGRRAGRLRRGESRRRLYVRRHRWPCYTA